MPNTAKNKKISVKEIENLIYDFCKSKNSLYEDGNLFGNEGIDSMGFLELLNTLEENLGIDLDLSDYDPLEFSTQKGLAKICQDKT